MSFNQREVFKICRSLSKKYKNDFVGFINETISFDGLKHKGLTWQQEEIADNLIEHRNVCVSAGGGIGKSALAALFVIWFLCTHLNSRVPTTAPSRKQLKDVLWSEIAYWLRRFKYDQIFELFTERLIIRHYPEWYAVARTVPKEGNAMTINDTLAGFHGKGDDDLMVIVDEASGVPDPVFTAIEGAMTSGAYILLISNPVSSGGYYYDTINDPAGKGKSYKVLYYDSRESPLVDKAFEQRIIDRYGKDSAMYITKVTGRPIGQLESTVVSPERFDRITAANRSRFTGEAIISVDVGGENDPSILCHKQGNSIMRWDVFHKHKETDLALEVERICIPLYADKGIRYRIIVDGIGKGSGVASILEQNKRLEILRFIGSENSDNKSMYKNKRSEGYYNLSKTFDSLHFPSKPPERLKKELANLFFDFSEGPINMEPKKKFIGRIGFSPDHADALMMANSINIITGVALRPYVSKRRKSVLNILKKEERYKKEYSKFIV